MATIVPVIYTSILTPTPKEEKKKTEPNCNSTPLLPPNNSNVHQKLLPNSKAVLFLNFFL